MVPEELQAILWGLLEGVVPEEPQAIGFGLLEGVVPEEPQAILWGLLEGVVPEEPQAIGWGLLESGTCTASSHLLGVWSAFLTHQLFNPKLCPEPLGALLGAQFVMSHPIQR